MPARRGAVVLSDVAPLAEYSLAARADSTLPPLVFCTGRQIPYAECVAQMIGAFFPGFPSVVENGAFLYDIAANKVLRHPALDETSLQAIAEARCAAQSFLERVGAAREWGKEICLSLNPPPEMAIESFFEIVCSELAQYADVLTITHSQSAVDVTPHGVDKAAGVLFLSEQTGIAPQEMLGIGDTQGDLPMLKLVGFPCGPANASAEVRAVSTFIARGEGPRGVAEILEKFTAWKAAG